MLVIAVRILETMFVVGAVGCVVVLALTAIEDLRTLVGLDDVDISENRKSIESGAGPPRRGEVRAQHHPQSLIIESGFGETSGTAGARRR